MGALIPAACGPPLAEGPAGSVGAPWAAGGPGLREAVLGACVIATTSPHAAPAVDPPWGVGGQCCAGLSARDPLDPCSPALLSPFPGVPQGDLTLPAASNTTPVLQPNLGRPPPESCGHQKPPALVTFLTRAPTSAQAPCDSGTSHFQEVAWGRHVRAHTEVHA